MTIVRRMLHQGFDFLRLSTEGMKNKGKGFNSRICRLVLVVGCSEKSIAKSTQPASP